MAPLPVEGMPTSEQNKNEDKETKELNLFCLTSMDKESLKASCTKDQLCNDSPCPLGMFCFQYNDCNDLG